MPCVDKYLLSGGGASRNVRRLDLVLGVPLYYQNNDAFYLTRRLSPFPSPAPLGTSLATAFSQFDPTLSKKFPIREAMNVESRAECYNVLNSAIFASPGGGTPRLNAATGILHPGQP